MTYIPQLILTLAPDSDSEICAEIFVNGQRQKQMIPDGAEGLICIRALLYEQRKRALEVAEAEREKQRLAEERRHNTVYNRVAYYHGEVMADRTIGKAKRYSDDYKEPKVQAKRVITADDLDI